MRVTDSSQVGSATSHAPEHWALIDWKLVYRNVRVGQKRLAKATQEGNGRKVKALQRMLTRSFSAKALAVKRVTENQGKKTAGVDGELWDTPQVKVAAIAQLKKQRYPKPCHYGGSTFQNRMGRNARWESRPCATGPCKRCICWPSTRCWNR